MPRGGPCAGTFPRHALHGNVGRSRVGDCRGGDARARRQRDLRPTHAGFRRDDRNGGRMTISFIGGGNMATALLGGLLARGRPARDMLIIEPLATQRAMLAERFPEATVAESAAA